MNVDTIVNVGDQVARLAAEIILHGRATQARRPRPTIRTDQSTSATRRCRPQGRPRKVPVSRAFPARPLINRRPARIAISSASLPDQYGPPGTQLRPKLTNSLLAPLRAR